MSHAAVVGIAVHSAMQQVIGEGANPREAWDATCATTLGTALSEISGMRRIANRFIRRATLVTDYVSSLSLISKPILEQQMTSSDGTIAGTPDLVLDTDDGLIVLDYKSGLVTNKNIVKTEYERQLQIYAALASDVLRRPVSRVILFSFKEQDPFTEVSVEPMPQKSLIDLVRENRDRFNERVPGQQPAKPSPPTCQWCPHQEHCPAFWDAVTDTWHEHLNGTAVSGIITTSPELAAIGKCAVHVETDAGTLAHGKYLLTHLPGWVAVQGAISSRLSAVRLGTRKADKETTLFFQPNSRVSIKVN